MSVVVDSWSQWLAACQAERAVTARFALHAPWALHSAGTEGVLIRVCSGAGYVMVVDGAVHTVRTGDVVMLARGQAHTMACSAAHLPHAQPLAALLAPAMHGPHGTHPLQLAHGGSGPLTELSSLHLWLPPLEAGWAAARLPAVLVLRPEGDALLATLATAITLVVRDSLAQQPGWQLAAARLGDWLLVHLLGAHWRSAAPAPGCGALADPGIAKAAAAMQAEPARAWSLQALAQCAGMSRTVFAQRFKALLGVAPMAYLKGCRMHCAAALLRRPRARVADVAEAVGYACDKAFARAFAREMGVSPHQYQRRAAGGAAPVAAGA